MSITITVLFALGLWLIMWAFGELIEVKHPVWKGVMIILAVFAGFGLLLSGAGVLR